MPTSFVSKVGEEIWHNQNAIILRESEGKVVPVLH